MCMCHSPLYSSCFKMVDYDSTFWMTVASRSPHKWSTRGARKHGREINLPKIRTTKAPIIKDVSSTDNCRLVKGVESPTSWPSLFNKSTRGRVKHKRNDFCSHLMSLNYISAEICSKRRCWKWQIQKLYLINYGTYYFIFLFAEI